MLFQYLLPLALVVAVGCQPAAAPPVKTTSHGPDDVPITEADVAMPASYSEALPRLAAYRDTIRSAIEAGTPHKAHRALDELDIVLRKLPTIAKQSRIPIEQWEAVNITARELRNLFDQLHTAIDENRAPDYRAVAQSIDAAIQRLTEVTP